MHSSQITTLRQGGRELALTLGGRDGLVMQIILILLGYAAQPGRCGIQISAHQGDGGAEFAGLLAQHGQIGRCTVQLGAGLLAGLPFAPGKKAAQTAQPTGYQHRRQQPAGCGQGGHCRRQCAAHGKPAGQALAPGQPAAR